MNRYFFSLLVGFCFVLWSVLPVSADWEFTKWGMSPEQVVQASNRQARPNKPGSGIPKSVLLTQDWQSGRFLFEVLYLFEKGRGGQVLTRIQLQLKNTELRKELLADLERKYGTPRGYIKEGIVTGAYWEKSGDNINYLTDQKTDTIHYAPLDSKRR
jgi:hypothetical protein